MQKVLPRPLAGSQTSIKPRNEPPIRERFDSSLRDASRSVQVRITPHHDFHFRFPASPDSLPRALVMPAVHQHSVVFVPSNDFLNLRRIEPAKFSITWRIGYVLQKIIGVSFK